MAHLGKCGSHCGAECRGEVNIGGRPSFRANVKALVEEIVSVLQQFPHERALDGLREKLEPVEMAVYPELRRDPDGS